VQRKIACAGTVSRSFAEASTLLQQLADLKVSSKQVERLTRRIGEERVVERQAEEAAFAALPLVQKFETPAGVSTPDLAVVMVDGGRLQILDRSDPPLPVEAALSPAESPLAAATLLPAAVEVAEAVEAWEEEKRSTRHWREDRIGLLLTMKSEASAVDPCPEVPASFLDETRIPELVRELSKSVKAVDGVSASAASSEVLAAAVPKKTLYEPPEVQKRTVVATRQPWRAFAPILATAAWAKGFQGATRKAFVADGAANNWRLQRRFFGSFVPILDFIHALSYVFAAALAGRSFALGWVYYNQWITWVWQGQVAQVIAALRERQAELGVAEQDEPATSPRQVVAETLTYLQNHQDKMQYDVYRRQGLPITSSLMESVVKEVSRRVKGTEKFWSEEGAEALLQLRADHLSDDEPLDDFWQRRQAAATGQRRYRRAG
jgi:hypothetical protein